MTSRDFAHKEMFRMKTVAKCHVNKKQNGIPEIVIVNKSLTISLGKVRHLLMIDITSESCNDTCC